MDVHGFLNEGANPNVGDADDYNNTPLHYAIRHSKMLICKMLLKAGGASRDTCHAARGARRAARGAARGLSRR